MDDNMCRIIQVQQQQPLREHLMRSYYDLTIDTIIVTACCGAYAITQNGRQRSRPSQLVPGETLTCEGCGGEHPVFVEEDVAWEN